MVISLAWRNLFRNRRRSILTGAAVAFGVLIVAWSIQATGEEGQVWAAS